MSDVAGKQNRGPYGHTLPTRALNRMEEAGASAYEWYEQEVRAFIDPKGYWLRLSDFCTHAGFLVLVAALVALNYHHGLWWAAGVAVAGVLAGLRSRFTSLGLLWGFLISLLAIGPLLPHAAALVTLGVFALTRMYFPQRLRPVAATAYSLTISAVMALPIDGDWVWAGSIAAAVVAGAAAWLANGRSLPGIALGALSAEDLSADPPAPPSRLPWLLRHIPGPARGLAMLNARDAYKNEATRAIVRKRIGGSAERKTALMMLAMRPGRGTMIVHDVDLPGAKEANLDHIVISQAGCFIVDTKRFGSHDNPGIVQQEGGEIVHRTNSGARSLQKTLSTIFWGVEAASETLDEPARGVMVVHNAAVKPGLTVQRGDYSIDIICADRMISHLEAGTSLAGMSGWWRRGHLRWALRKFVSSTTGSAPSVVRPLGMKRADRRKVVRAEDPQAPKEVVQVNEPPARPSERTPQKKVRHAERKPVPAHTGDPRAMERDPAKKVAMDLGDRWEQMRVSEPAAPDDVPEELRGLWRGTPITVVEFAHDDMQWRSMVAMTGPCQGADGPYVWACTPEQYAIYADDKRHVNVTTVPLAKVMTGGDSDG